MKKDEIRSPVAQFAFAAHYSAAMKPDRRLSTFCAAGRAIAFGVGGSIFALAALPMVNAQQQRFEQQPVRAVPARTPVPAPIPDRQPAPTPKPTPKVFVALPNYNEETATRLQIFLDNNNFGPGKIDGKMGEFFRKALISFKHAHAQRETGVVDQTMLDQVPQTFTTYTIKGDDLAYVGNLPTAHEEQAKLKFLPYTSLLEFVAERFHSAEDYIKKLNPGMDWENLEPGDELKVPNVLPFEIEKVTEQKISANPKLVARKIYVDTAERLLEVFENDKLVCVFPITPGSTALPAPVGTWKIQGAATWPWFRYDEGMLNYGVRTENYYNLPPGPNNLVGVLWMSLNKTGIGIHGTNNPETIGRAASHGCIRLANWDAIRVKDLVSVGNTVIIF
jgi:lipoprotein-anchoring transpeptidase ErfK/SrfK